MDQEGFEYLSKRFQQIMEVIYLKGRVTAVEVEEALPGSPTNSTVRTQLRELETRGLVRHTVVKGKFYYEPTLPKPNAAVEAMRRFLKTFADDSLESAFVAMLSAKEADLSEAEATRLRQIIDAAARREG